MIVFLSFFSTVFSNVMVSLSCPLYKCVCVCVCVIAVMCFVFSGQIKIDIIAPFLLLSGVAVIPKNIHSIKRVLRRDNCSHVCAVICYE